MGDLQSVVEPLTKHGATDPNFGAVDGEARRLVALAVSCEEISNELLALLQDLKIPNQTAYKHWHAIRQTWRNTTKSKKIKNIEDRLDRVRTQLNTRLACADVSSDSTSGMLSAFDNLTKMNSQMEANTTSKLNAMKSELIASVDDHMKNSTAIDHALIRSKLNAFMQEASVSGKSQAILKSLRYSEFKKRYFDVKPAHARTFQWIFEDSDIGFTDWLNSHSGLFWVCGKAGSGKSTLMKYILGHDTTTDLLQSWAKDKTLITASHFFWVSGTELQRSQEGLLRSLLFQILKQHCGLIPEVCMSHWEEAVPEFFDPRSIEKLSDALARLAKIHEDYRICLFIDGLDEYEGEKSEIIKIINTMAASPHIKLCISSRPWNEFRIAYKENQKIHLEKLTETDIRLYVEENLHNQPEMDNIFSDNTESEALISKIVQKACGVFLRVYLVMRSIARGPIDGADLRDLRMMVDDYPEDLIKLFDRIFHSIEKRYHRETARIFRTCLESYYPPSVATFRHQASSNIIQSI
ncbi:hypothetical protein SLS56_008309 [Neofusicoccum ribis]|uniref:Nephrocystin 3-like N-terminal domain-containing protein n=1 Tax=Neofusicoccum ribis TaxID=45134 RepID=A0ABR3SKI8_9PEZI